MRRPFLGEIVERATDEQYYNGFDCQKIGWVQKLPIQWERAPPFIREKYMDKHYEYRNFSKGAESLHSPQMNIDQALKFILSVNEKSCRK